MIYDSLENFKKYTSVHPFFDHVLEFLNSDIMDISTGRHIIYDDVFAIVSDYVPKDVSQGIIECHHKYIDIQIVLKGIENIGICHKNECEEEDYDEVNDFQELIGSVDFLVLKEGYFVIFFPHDGHMPQIKNVETAENVKKMVIKVPVAGKTIDNG